LRNRDFAAIILLFSIQEKHMRIMIGSPPTGEDFYPRKPVIKQLIRALQAEHVLFLAPRRTGKTSVLLHLREVAPAKAIFIDLEGFDHPRFWVQSMISALRNINDEQWLQAVKKIPDFMARFRSDVLEISEKSWEENADNLLKDLNNIAIPIWFLLDEFPIMIDKIASRYGKDEASSVLHWLRRVRQQNTNSAVRFLLTGSIGLDSVMHRHNIRGPANDLRREVLSTLTVDEALALMLKLAQDNDIALDEDSARVFIARLGSAIWPYFIQLYVAELQDYYLRTDEPIDIENIYRAITLGKRNQYSDNMWVRLREIFNDVEALNARQILKLVANQETGIPLENLRAQLPQLEDDDFHNVLDVLQHDGYLIEQDNGNICFFSHLLRDYWRHKGRV